jgi:hypothetical protein
VAFLGNCRKRGTEILRSRAYSRHLMGRSHDAVIEGQSAGKVVHRGVVRVVNEGTAAAVRYERGSRADVSDILE